MFGLVRGRALKQVAQRRGWRFDKKGTWHRGLPGTPFNRGTKRRSTNGVSGTLDGVEFQAFSFRMHETDSSGDGGYQFFCALVCPSPSPHVGVVIRRRHLWDKAASAMGRGAKGTGSEDFDAKWVASRVDDEAPTRITPALQQVIQAGPKLTWTWVDDRLIVVRNGGLSVERLEEMVSQAVAFRRAASAA